MSRTVKAALALIAALGLLWLGPHAWRAIAPTDTGGTAQLVLVLRCPVDIAGTLVAEGAGGRVEGTAQSFCRSGEIVLPRFSRDSRIGVTFTPEDGAPVRLEAALNAGVSAAPDHWVGLLELSPGPPYLAIGRF